MSLSLVNRLPVTFKPKAVGTYNATLTLEESSGVKDAVPISGTAATDGGGGG